MMALNQKKLREVVFQLLYSHDVSAVQEDDIVPLMMEQAGAPRSVLRGAYERMEKIASRIEELDRLIAEKSTSYAFERIPRVERNILRLSLWEMIFDDEIPPKVAIVEAMRLAKKFCTPESTSFVNAILDGCYKESAPLPLKEEDKEKQFFDEEKKRCP